MNQRSASFRIPALAVPLALAAIKALANTPNRMGGGSSKGEHWYCWVTTEEFVNAKNIEDAIKAWRWEVEMDDDGDVIDICFAGEKLGDDVFFFNALAPFVEAGSYIEMSGEDDAYWKWVFDGESMTELHGQIVYEGDCFFRNR